MSLSRDRRHQRRKTLRAAAAAASKPVATDLKITAPVVITASSAVAGQPVAAPRIDIVAYNGGELIVDGFDLPVVLDYAGAIIPETLPLNVDHCQSITHLLGQGTTALAGSSLSIHGTITASNPNADEVIRLAKEGFRWQASVKAIVMNSRRVPPGQAVTINGRQFTGPLIHATESQLTHCAVLGEGADQTSSVHIAAKAARVLKGQAIMTFEAWVASIGLDPTALTPEATAALQAQFAILYPPAAATEPEPVAAQGAMVPDPNDPEKPVAAAARAASARNSQAVLLAAARKAEADEIRRVATIRAKARDFPLIAAKAVEEGWSADKVELEVMKANRPTGPSHNPPGAPPVMQVLEAALCQTRKIRGHEKQFSDQVLQAAHSQFRRGVGLQQVLLVAAAANGYSLSPGQGITAGNIREVMRYAFNPQVLQASSGGDLSSLLTTTANRELIDGYMEEDQAWREIAGIKSVTDFNTVTSYRMLDNMQYEELGPNGEIRHGTVDKESYTRSIDTYAKMFALTRKDIISDNLGAFDDLKTRIGRGGAMKLNRLFWTRFLANSSFFTSGRGNYITGATTTLLTDGVGLQLALDAFDALRTPTADGAKVPGGLVGGAPSILLTTGGAMFNRAEVIYKNSNLGNGTANADANIHSGKYKPVKSVFLGDSSIAGYSTTAWYLLRDPKVMPTVVVSFLNGVETPTVEQSEADFDTLGIQFRGYHDFGVDLAEYLGGVKSKGAA